MVEEMNAEQTKALLKAAVSIRMQQELPDWVEREGLDLQAFNDFFIGMARAARERMGVDAPPLEFILALMSAGFTMGWESRKIVADGELAREAVPVVDELCAWVDTNLSGCVEVQQRGEALLQRLRSLAVER